MNAIVRSELLKLRRPAILLGAGCVLPLLSVLATAAVLMSATDKAPTDGPGTSIEALSVAGGLTEGFAATSVFLGLLFFALFAFSFGTEHSGGTLRTLLTREPRRLRLLAGKWLALSAFVAATLLVALVGSGLTAVVLAPSQDLDTSDWFGIDGLVAAGADYRNVLLAALLYGSAGAAVATLLRSGAVAVGAGLVWLGPAEHLLSDGWSGASRWFPGLLFESIAQGGTSDSALGRGLLLGPVLAAALLAIAAAVFARLDVTT